MTSTNDPADLDSLELGLLLEGLHRRHGFDLRDYSRASLSRRIERFKQQEGIASTLGLLERALREGDLWERLLRELTIHTTSMFRDPTFFLAFREKVVPLIRTYPFIRIWVAGCSTGEELYSTAIILHEEGLLDRCRLYATDLNEEVVSQAKTGVFPVSSMKESTGSYQAAGGQRPFSEYYTVRDELAILSPALSRTTIFAAHNLVSDASFNEFQMIFIRNVMIYFNRSLQDRVLRLVHGSLCRLGFVCLGRRESMRFSPHEECYEEFVPGEKLYRKVRE
ncbi:MAG: protein-glutamate O-methyltransferase CheR [Candidatus Riflebacteria bacterium]|nr:protein-glutamate O-methyltransferase CheR [Candidatus Riflebacteria bacterium]